MTSDNQPLALITGATQGIGILAAKALAREHNYHVILGVRDVEAGQEIADSLIQDGHRASVVELNLDSQQSVLAAIATVNEKFGYLDVLINNAAILWDQKPSLGKWELYSTTFATNVIGPGVLTEGLIPALRKAKSGPPRIVFMTSRMGSLQISLDKTTPFYNIDYKAYDASKAAVNMLAVNFSRVLDDVGGKVNTVCPGYLKTGLTNYYEFGEEPEMGIIRMIEMATLGSDGPTGTFSDRHGPVPW